MKKICWDLILDRMDNIRNILLTEGTTQKETKQHSLTSHNHNKSIVVKRPTRNQKATSESCLNGVDNLALGIHNHFPHCQMSIAYSATIPANSDIPRTFIKIKSTSVNIKKQRRKNKKIKYIIYKFIFQKRILLTICFK